MKGSDPSASAARYHGERNEAPPIAALKRAKRIIVDVTFLDGTPFSFAAASETPRTIPTLTVEWREEEAGRLARSNPASPLGDVPRTPIPVRSLADVGKALSFGWDVTLAAEDSRKGEAGSPSVLALSGAALDLLPQGEVAPLRATSPESHVSLAFVASGTLVLVFDPRGNGKDAPSEATDQARCLHTDPSFDFDAVQGTTVTWSLLQNEPEGRGEDEPVDDAKGTSLVEKPFDPVSQCVPAGASIAARARPAAP